ncbi:MAG: RNA methyltransferase [Bacteroides sp.]|nr:RNA methyltransferase [Bacteroides sp.]
MMIESRKNQTVVKSRGLLAEKKLREKEGLIAAEGAKLCAEALDSGLTAEYALVSQEAEKKFPELVERLRESCPLYTVTDEIYFHISGQKSPQGIFLALKPLDKSKNLDRILEKDKIIILDRIQDSGNLGTIIRTAEAFGMEGAVLSGGCADPFSPKALRASMGSSFRLPVLVSADIVTDVGMLKARGFKIYAAMLDESAQKLRDVDFSGRRALVVGNEGHGVSGELAAVCEKLYIPIKGAESLNAAAAAAVICYEMGKE